MAVGGGAVAPMGSTERSKPYGERPSGPAGRRGATRGQVTVELLLILPVFMLMLFFIMELGNLAYQTILVNHSAYELARIGSLIAGPRQGGGGGSNMALARQKMKDSLCNMYKNCGLIQMVVSSKFTYPDPQVLATGLTHLNEDMLVELVFPAKLVFPGSKYFLASPPRGRGIRWITVKVRMPIEKPFFQ